MAQVRFTRANVGEIAKQVEEFTGGIVGLSGTGADLGNGVRYIDKNTQTVWLGDNGARECAAYMIGAALAVARHRGVEIPESLLWVRDYQDAYSAKQRFRNWESQGAERVASVLGKEG